MSAVIRRARLPLALLVLGVACAVLVARLPPDLERSVVTRRHHGSDPLLSAALLRFDVESLLRHPTRYFQPPILFPDPNPLRGTEPLVSEALLALPFRLALGDRPAAVYTGTKLATLALVVLFTGLCLRELGVRSALCLVGGGFAVLVGTMPVYVDRLQAVSIQWLPAAGFFASRFLRRGRRADTALFTLCAFLLVQASLYTTVMLLATLPFLVPPLWSRRVEIWRRGRPLLAGLALAAALSGAVLWPYLQRRADVAAYSSPAYAAVKTWQPAALGSLAISPPEYAQWPLGPAADWQGLFPGTAFLLLLSSAAVLAAVHRSTPGEWSTADPLVRNRAFGLTKRLLAAALAVLAGAIAWSVFGGGTAPAVVADAALWTALGAWCGRLALWPAAERGRESPYAAQVASAAALAALVLCLLSLGSPVRWQADGEPLLLGLFEPLSRVFPPVRELRELNRCLLPAAWLASVATVLSLERRLREHPEPRARSLANALTVLLLLLGLGERLVADTRKGTVPAPPESYALLRRSTAGGGMLELPFDPWGRIDSVYRMLWQPSHGRPIVAGRTGIEPGWYLPAQQVFDGFPSEESLRLAQAWRIATVLDTRPLDTRSVADAGERGASGAANAWPTALVLRAERAEQAGRRTDAVWRLFELVQTPGDNGIESEPAPGPGEWVRPAAANAAEAAACDGRVDTSVEVTAPAGLVLLVPGGASLVAIDLDYGHGLFNRVPKTLRVLGLEDGEWREIAVTGAAWLRARAAFQLLRDQQARLVLPLVASRASRVRLASPDGPWDAPEVRLRLAPGH